MNRISVFAAAGEAAAVLGGAIDLASQAVSKLHRWRRRQRTRIALGHLDDRLLADIGLTRADVLYPQLGDRHSRDS